MQTACTHCGAEHSLKESELGGHSKVQFRCSKCGKSTVVQLKRRSDATVVMSPLPSFARAAPGGLMAEEGYTSRNLRLQEARDTYIKRKCMDAPRGVFFDEGRVRAAVLREGADFRLGVSVTHVNSRRK